MATGKKIDWRGWVLLAVAVALLGWVVLGHIGCEAQVPLRPEIVEVVYPKADPAKPMSVPLSEYPSVEAAFEKKQEEKAAEIRAKADEVAEAVTVTVAKATRNVEREVRALQERLEDDVAAEQAKAAKAIKELGATVARLKAEAAGVKALQTPAVQAARDRQATIDQLTTGLIGLGQTAAATQTGTPWGPFLTLGLGALAAWQTRRAAAASGEAAKANSALDAVTSGIEEAKALPGVPTAALQLVKAEIAKQAQPGDITTIETSIARQNYAAKV